MELVIFFGAWILVAVAAVMAGEDSRPGINDSREWGLHSWDRSD